MSYEAIRNELKKDAAIRNAVTAREAILMLICSREFDGLESSLRTKIHEAMQTMTDATVALSAK